MREKIQTGTFNLMRTLQVLEPDCVELEQDLADGLTLRYPEIGERKGVSVEPCFPVTNLERFIVFRDSGGEEIGVLENLSQLEPKQADILRYELAKQHFIPVITAINAVYREFQIPIWEVQTDRGPRRLELKSTHDAHRMHGGRIYVRDSEGNGYVIPDYRELDPASRELVELYV
jgi:hypothetical protein